MAAGYEPELEEIMKEQFQNAQQTVDRAAATLKAAGFNAKGRVVGFWTWRANGTPT
jgi:hypothetical protein